MHEQEQKSRWRRLGLAGLHLAALWSLAVAEPLFDLMHKNPDFLAARRMDGSDIVLFALGLALVPPLLLLALEAVADLIGERIQRGLHLFFVAALVALLLIQTLKKTGPDQSAVLIALAALLGIAGAALYARAAVVRSFMTVLSAAPVAFLALFLFSAPISDLVFANDVSASSSRVKGHVPVVMVVFDEVSTVALEDAHEHIDPSLFPNLASLARNATWYRYATAPTDETTTAVPALLTGSLPKKDAQPILSKYPHNLFTFLGGSYRMEVSQEATDLCPRSVCRELTRGSQAAREQELAQDTGLVYLHVIAPPGIERGLPSVSDTLGGFASDTGKTKAVGGAQTAQTTGRTPVLHELAGGRPERFERVVEAVGPSRRPSLYFKHSLLPHVPFQYLPSGRRYRSQPHEVISGLTDAPSWGNDYLNAQAYQRHLLQMQFADHLLGTMLRRLRDEHLYDRALVVVTADNGESFLHRNANRHEATPANVEDIADTPLLIKAPGQRRGGIADGHVRTIDVLPTIARLLHARLPWRVQGRPAWPSTAGIPAGVVVYQRSGNRLTLSPAEFHRRVRASLERKLRVFGSDGRGPGLFRFGPHPELVGRSLNSAHLTRGGSASARINGSGYYRDVDLQSGFVPAQISGRVTGTTAPGRDLAFAVNGRIAGVAPSFQLKGSDDEQFSVVVSDGAFHDGRNRVQVLWVRRGGSAPVLEELGSAG